MSIIQGKLEDELPKIPDNSIHLIFTDPPYNIGYQYKSYKDKLSDEDYYAWTDEWMNG
jgi:site-specific DNA-methyltransferase (adenine-specific)